jgi:3-hydroxyisobutyrate dehydrogenase-like beta-hydroxyacid dehydrogenase
MRLAVVGTGLMGASVGLAAKRAGVEDVRGYDPDDAAASVALERGAVDEAGSLDDVLSEADLTVVAAPVTVLPSLVEDVLAASARPSRTSARRRTGRPSSRSGLSAAIRSAAGRAGAPSTRPPSCSTERPGS